MSSTAFSHQTHKVNFSSQEALTLRLLHLSSMHQQDDTTEEILEPNAFLFLTVQYRHPFNHSIQRLSTQTSFSRRFWSGGVS